MEQINTSNIRWLFKRELAVSIINGIVLSVLVGASTYLWFQDKMLAILISCALVINLISSVIAGILVPMILRKFNQDIQISSKYFKQPYLSVLSKIISKISQFKIFKQQLKNNYIDRLNSSL